jgi:NADPH-dependent curcumin reductase CurA
MVPNKGLIFKKVPYGWPVAGEHLAVEERAFDLDANPPDQGLMVRNFYVSFDPFQRGAMRNPDSGTYSMPSTVGEPIVNCAVSKVVKSSHPNFKPGELVCGMFGTEEYSIVPSEMMAMVRMLDNPYDLDPQLFVGALGIAGLTAYASFYEFGRAEKGQTIFVSAASGAVGQIVGQLAKREGLYTIGSVGSDKKLDFITKELGFDAGFNYKKEKPDDALARLAPTGLDIYYENVGGEHLDAALVAMKDYGRISMYPLTTVNKDSKTDINSRERHGLAIQSPTREAIRR